MDKLYLAIKKTISNHVLKGNLPELVFKWGNNKEDCIKELEVPLILFNINGIRYESYNDKFPVGEMEISLKLFFPEEINNKNPEAKVLKNFKLIKQIESIIKSVESDETGIISTVQLEILNSNESFSGIHFTFATPYYPVFSNTFNLKSNETA